VLPLLPPTAAEAREIGRTQTRDLNDRSKKRGQDITPPKQPLPPPFLQVMRMGISPIDMRSS
jgi:hypothetical protein